MKSTLDVLPAKAGIQRFCNGTCPRPDGTQGPQRKYPLDLSETLLLWIIPENTVRFNNKNTHGKVVLFCLKNKILLRMKFDYLATPCQYRQNKTIAF